jgi:aspartyl/glutamyl-tRNA(Asn/Gln) amidotransferase C subunit
MKDEEFERLLKISRVRLSDDEKSRMRRDIEEAITWLDKVQAIDCREDPAYQPIEVPTRFRKDVVKKFENVDGLKKDAELNDDYIRGPKL